MKKQKQNPITQNAKLDKACELVMKLGTDDVLDVKPTALAIRLKQSIDDLEELLKDPEFLKQAAMHHYQDEYDEECIGYLTENINHTKQQLERALTFAMGLSSFGMYGFVEDETNELKVSSVTEIIEYGESILNDGEKWDMYLQAAFEREAY